MLAREAVETGQRLPQRGDPDLALEKLRQDPKNGNYHYRLGRYYRLKNREKAIEHFSAAVRLQPNDGESAYFLGSLLIDSGQKEKGLAIFRQLAKDPNTPWGKMAQKRLAKL